jgi:hypothetical protein
MTLTYSEMSETAARSNQNLKQLMFMLLLHTSGLGKKLWRVIIPEPRKRLI